MPCKPTHGRIAGVAHCALVSLWLSAGALEGAETQGKFEQAVGPFFAEHCARCHGETKQKGNLRLDTLARDFANPLIAAKWADALERISSGEMPPEKEPKPKPEMAAAVAEWIATRLKE